MSKVPTERGAVKGQQASATGTTRRYAQGAALTWTEQVAYLDGLDGADAPRLRREGTAEMLDDNHLT